jgi:hypothetical protein
MTKIRIIKSALLVLVVLVSLFSQAQKKAEVRGFVRDKTNGDEVEAASVYLQETRQGFYTNEDGFYSISGIKPGAYTLVCLALGFDSLEIKIQLGEGFVKKQDLYLVPDDKNLEEVKVTGKRRKKTTTTAVSLVSVTPKELTQIPTVGGEPDLIQYLQVLPGVVFTGDQGGQLYIRGGSPVMNKVLLDGMTIYNPFHSIGLFSVFDADIMKSADVYSAGFGAEYGGRISAIVDVKTRDGNRNKVGGKIAANTFGSKFLLEGPLKKYRAGKGSSSYILSYKNSFLDRTSKVLYKHAGEGQLPYTFSDFYSKLSFNAPSGSHLKMFYFNFNDKVDFANTTSYDWKTTGFGSKFLLVPPGSKVLVDGVFSYSKYLINQRELDDKPRSSGIKGFNLGLNFSYFIANDELKYGVTINGFKTEFLIFNSNDRKIDQFENTTEIAGFIKYKRIQNKKLIIEPGFRIQYYASLGNTSLEPRLKFKYLINKRLRLKGAAGLYSQNLISAVSDRDVVNLFYGFLSGPDDLPASIGGKALTHRLQKAQHAVLGLEIDLNSNSEINVEVYVKDFTQISNINRDKIFDDNSENANKPEYLKSDFIVETGMASGFDITYKYQARDFYVWLVYSNNRVTRFDGIREYVPHFDRRHNINVVMSHQFGKDKSWEANVRWNFGSGFPFTLTQGFFENIDFQDGLGTDYTTTNGDLEIVYDNLNRGRLPYYHRLDFSVKRTIVLKVENDKPRTFMEANFSVTNVYDRQNIFYFDRVKYERVNQLPFMPSLAVNYNF